MSDEAFTEQGRPFVESLRRGYAVEIPVPPATEEEARDYFRSVAFGLLARDAGRATKTGRIQAVWEFFARVVRLSGDLESSVRDEFVLRWPSVDVEIVVGDLREEHGDLTAEITVHHAARLPLAIKGNLVRIRSHTCREFSRYFRIVDYIEQGATSSQDLVVMRKE